MGLISWGLYWCIYGLKNQYAPNFPSECLESGMCIIVLNLLGKKKPYFCQMLLKIHPWGPAQANGSLKVCKKRSLFGVVLSALLSAPSKYSQVVPKRIRLGFCLLYPQPNTWFSNCFFLLKTEIHMYILNTEPFLCDKRGLRYMRNKIGVLIRWLW